MMLLVILLAVMLGLFVWIGHRLITLVQSRIDIYIVFLPLELRMKEVVLAILLMLGKSVLKVVRIMRNPKKSPTLPAPFTLSKDDIVRYQEAVGLQTGDETVLKALHIPIFLSAVTEPAMLLFLASSSCLINPLGAVNVRNRFELLRPDPVDLGNLRTLRDASLAAYLRPESRRVRRGIEYDFEVNLLACERAARVLVFH
jgi:hypothetical protein